MLFDFTSSPWPSSCFQTPSKDRITYFDVFFAVSSMAAALRLAAGLEQVIRIYS